jgi:hypothetical protein
MRANLRSALVAAGTLALAATAVLGAATPAFAKSDTQLTGPRAAQPGRAFRLTVTVGDDAGAHTAWTRLEQLGPHGRYQWRGTWHRLHLMDRDFEWYVFTPIESRRGTATFRAVVSNGYAVTNPVKVVVR